MLLLLLFVAVPIIEIALFIQVGGAIGTWPTIGIVVITAVVGTMLLRTQGIATLGNLQSSLGKGENPVTHIAHGALILVAGVVLLTPGFFTDAVGLALLIPQIRNIIIKYGAERIKNGSFTVVQGDPFGKQDQRPPEDPDVVEAEYTDLNEDNSTPGNSGWTNNKPD